MRIQHRSVKRRDEEIKISQHDSHSTVNDAVGAVDETFGLVRVACGVGCEGEGGISGSRGGGVC